MSAKRPRPSAGRAVFYSRDSGGQHETTPGKYVEWAHRRATELGLRFSGDASEIEQLIKHGGYQSRDLFFDNCVSGNVLARNGLDALFRETERDRTISHVFIPRRDRLARPDRPSEGVELEHRFRKDGLTLVFQDRVLAPLKRGARENIGDQITALVDYDASGKFRDEHAERMVWAKLSLAENGHATGGRAPYGFRRFLVDNAGTVVRPLADGEIIRQAHHHVEWRPGPQSEIDVVLRILEMLLTMPANQVAKTLTAEGIPSPDANRTRTDNGVPHVVRGVWHQTTIVGIARNPIVRALVSFGRRSAGDRRRVTPEGPRLIEDEDIRHDGKPKVRQVPEDQRITVPAAFSPLLAPEAAERLDRVLKQRAGTQRGKPRSSDPERNPLGARIYDMACHWPMYRAAAGDSYFYRCGLYQQSDGCRCRHNRIPGPAAAKVGLEVIRQQFRDPAIRQALQSRLEAKVAESIGTKAMASELANVRSELAAAESRVARVERNMAEAETSAQLSAMKKFFNEATADAERLKSRVEEVESRSVRMFDLEGTVAKAMSLLDRLPDLAANTERPAAVKRLFDLVNLRMYLSFEEVKKTKRTINQLTGGIITIGSVAAPIEPYNGPTARGAVEKASETGSEASPTDEREKSLRNESRGDRTPIELFIAGIRGWEAGIRRYFPGKSTPE